MAWGAIAYDSRTSLVFVEGSMKATACINNVVNSVFLPILATLDNPLFFEDNMLFGHVNVLS